MTAPRPNTGFFDWLSPLIFDLGVPLVFFPVGGIDAIRERTLDALEVTLGMKVLEFDCGTGALTAGAHSRFITTVRATMHIPRALTGTQPLQYS